MNEFWINVICVGLVGLVTLAMTPFQSISRSTSGYTQAQKLGPLPGELRHHPVGVWWDLQDQPRCTVCNHQAELINTRSGWLWVHQGNPEGA